MKVAFFSLGVLLQLPWLVLWAHTVMSTSGGRGPGSMALALPAVIAMALWFAGGLVHVVLLVREIIKARTVSKWTRLLGAAVVAWVCATVYFAVR